MADFDRRDLLKLFGLGGVVVASSLAGVGSAAGDEPPSPLRLFTGAVPKRTDGHDDFYFVQLSDTHWGFKGPLVNPRADTTLQHAIDAVNALPHPPSFVVFTGDLTHTTDDPAERRKRMTEFRKIASTLRTPVVHFMPGEHDAALDKGEAFIEQFGPTHKSFDHQGVHFITLDNVSDPKAFIGGEQLDWLAADLAKHDRSAPIVLLTHRPLFDLAPTWDWATPDGAKALKLFDAHENVTVFYGHIHQEHHFTTGRIQHHAARSLMFALPAPMSVPKKSPIPWDPAHPFKGLGFREVEDSRKGDTRVEAHDLETT